MTEPKRCCNLCALYNQDMTYWGCAKKFCECHTTTQPTVRMGEPTPPPTEWEEMKGRMAQEILGKLEYRGFYDAGKYLDDDIIEAIEPFFTQALAEQKARMVEVVEERLNKTIRELDQTTQYGEGTYEGIVHSLHIIKTLSK